MLLRFIPLGLQIFNNKVFLLAIFVYCFFADDEQISVGAILPVFVFDKTGSDNIFQPLLLQFRGYITEILKVFLLSYIL
jgi:hypothetical protein